MIGSSLNFSFDLDFKPIWYVTTIHAELKRTFVLGAANSPIARTAELWILDELRGPVKVRFGEAALRQQ